MTKTELLNYLIEYKIKALVNAYTSKKITSKELINEVGKLISR